MKKILAFLLIAAMVLTIGGCSSAKTEKTYKVGICQLIQHQALDSATKGFQDALKDALGDKVTIDLQNASGDSANCATIVNGFVSQGTDLIMANGTAALQAAASATTTIPILGTSITAYGVALNMQEFNGTVGGNISGTSDLAPLEKQAAMFPALLPDAKNIGLLYCSAEPNSIYQIEVIETELAKLGLTSKRFSFSDSNDIAAVCTTACQQSDAIYVPTDNIVASSTGIIDGICRPAGIPIIAGEPGICSGCGIATLGISYYNIGKYTGEMAAKILKGESKIEEMPIEYDEDYTYQYNVDICKELNITVPDTYTAVS